MFNAKSFQLCFLSTEGMLKPNIAFIYKRNTVYLIVVSGVDSVPWSFLHFDIFFSITGVVLNAVWQVVICMYASDTLKTMSRQTFHFAVTQTKPIYLLKDEIHHQYR